MFAELSALLPGYPNRVHALLRHAGIVNHPTADRATPFYQRQHASTDRCQHGVIGPVGPGDEVVQRLVGRLRPFGRYATAIGSTLLRAPGSSSQYNTSGTAPPDRHGPTLLSGPRHRLPVVIRCSAYPKRDPHPASTRENLHPYTRLLESYKNFMWSGPLRPDGDQAADLTVGRGS
jgi:hypothetical protein